MSRLRLALVVVFLVVAAVATSADAEVVVLDAVQDTQIHGSTGLLDTNYDDQKILVDNGNPPRSSGVIAFDLSGITGDVVAGTMEFYQFDENGTTAAYSHDVYYNDPVAGVPIMDETTLTFTGYQDMYGVGHGESPSANAIGDLSLGIGSASGQYHTGGSADATDLAYLNRRRQGSSDPADQYAQYLIYRSSGARRFDDREGGNPIRLVLTVVPFLDLQVNPLTGLMRIANDSGESKTINYYRVEGPTNSLDSDGWLSLDEQGLDSLGGGEGQSWRESGNSSDELLSESFLLGNSVLDDGEIIGLGAGYNATLDARNLDFYYGNTADGNSSQGGLKHGTVSYAVPGDMNNDTFLTLDDVPLFVQALTNRAAYDANDFGVDADFVGDFDGNGVLDTGDITGFSTAVQNAASAEGATVPEPAGALLLMLAACCFVSTNRQRRAGRLPTSK